jgi:hypothetical protein
MLRSAALKSFIHTQLAWPFMKRFFALFAAAALAALCAACAGGSAPPSSGASGITMYGTIDEGVTFHK